MQASTYQMAVLLQYNTADTHTVTDLRNCLDYVNWDILCLQASTYQMAVLLQYNTADTLTVSQILETA